mmetsp:Transcript_56860/g.115759  ORF Transcript_56860/g.115759 Transcript_56860/m.115759 type:complete len:366 (+) Transcript_56860:129-1226(+)
MTNSTAISTSRRRPRTSNSKLSMTGFPLSSLVLLSLLISQSATFTSSFGLSAKSARDSFFKTPASSATLSDRTLSPINNRNSNSPTALNVWWFGGSEQNEAQGDDESCELVAVRIERPTSNSRKIAGELSVPGVSVDDVWSILTDYDRLSIHVPNLKESRIVRDNNNNSFSGQKSYPGDGSYKCQLYQVGAQKIVGFDFSASVTMDMTERVLSASTSNARKIYFKCVDSQFFSAFDGSWTVQEQQNTVTGEREVLCSYDVLVKPKGPVPVAALEWRIREDVPTNLRAVKAATLGMVSSSGSKSMELATVGAANGTTSGAGNGRRTQRGSKPTKVVPVRMANQGARQLAAVMVDWERGETMAKYLE